MRRDASSTINEPTRSPFDEATPLPPPPDTLGFGRADPGTARRPGEPLPMIPTADASVAAALDDALDLSTNGMEILDEEAETGVLTLGEQEDLLIQEIEAVAMAASEHDGRAPAPADAEPLHDDAPKKGFLSRLFKK